MTRDLSSMETITFTVPVDQDKMFPFEWLAPFSRQYGNGQFTAGIAFFCQHFIWLQNENAIKENLITNLESQLQEAENLIKELQEKQD